MSLPVKTGLPFSVDLPAGYSLRFAALDPSTGAAVSGVTVANASIFAADLSGGDGSALEVGDWTLVPGPQ